MSEHWQLRLRLWCSWSPFHWQAGHLLLLLTGYWPWISSSSTSTPGTVEPCLFREGILRGANHRSRPPTEAPAATSSRPKSAASPKPNNPRPLTLRARDQSSDRSLREYQGSLRKSRGAEENERKAWITYQPRSGGNGGRRRRRRDLLVLKSVQRLP